MNMAIESEIVGHLDAGFCTPEQWEQYWWAERAEAFQAIASLEQHIATLRAYADRCTALIDEAKQAQPNAPLSESQHDHGGHGNDRDIANGTRERRS